jgi:hypothetical protein
MKKFLRHFLDFRVLLLIVIGVAGFATFQSIMLAHDTFERDGRTYTHYNNYVIFKQSFFHLAEGRDLYQSYPEEHHDLYKYSPTFALFFSAFAVFPDGVGLLLWNLLNVLLFLCALWKLPGMLPVHKGLILLIGLMELVKTTQNEQSNALMAALLILTFIFLEKNNYLAATFFVTFSVFIKIFGVVGLALFLLYPGKWKLTLYTIMWTIILFLLPLLVIDLSQLRFLYQSWGTLLFRDHVASFGISVMGWLNAWFGITGGKAILLLAGSVIFLLPFIRTRAWQDASFRLLTLASILIWIVIFNHKSESPTLIIAVAGVAIWFFGTPRTHFSRILLFSVLIITSATSTDLIPGFIRQQYIQPYMLQVVPLILVWLAITIDLLFNPIRFSREKIISLS